MQHVVEQDKVESAAITYTIENNSEIQSPFSKNNNSSTSSEELEEKEDFGAFSLVNASRSIAGSAIGGIRETQYMLDFFNKHNIASI
jgi:D-arabinose 1-dehydrogenase-like Zn-dependent alcohol dehydrogenase